MAVVLASAYREFRLQALDYPDRDLWAQTVSRAEAHLMTEVCKAALHLGQP